MFSIVPDPTFAAPVLLSRPAAAAPIKVTFTFRHKSLRQLNAWLAKAKSYKDDAEFLGEVIESWGPEIVGADSKPLPYSKKALAELLDKFPGSGAEILRDYRKHLQDARLGN
jgi:hypothetical protein